MGADIEITVVDIRGDKVRLGCVAPDYMAIHRKEVFDAIRRENHGHLKPTHMFNGKPAWQVSGPDSLGMLPVRLVDQDILYLVKQGEVIPIKRTS